MPVPLCTEFLKQFSFGWSKDQLLQLAELYEMSGDEMREGTSLPLVELRGRWLKSWVSHGLPTELVRWMRANFVEDVDGENDGWSKPRALPALTLEFCNLTSMSVSHVLQPYVQRCLKYWEIDTSDDSGVAYMFHRIVRADVRDWMAQNAPEKPYHSEAVVCPINNKSYYWNENKQIWSRKKGGGYHLLPEKVGDAYAKKLHSKGLIRRSERFNEVRVPPLQLPSLRPCSDSLSLLTSNTPPLPSLIMTDAGSRHECEAHLLSHRRACDPCAGATQAVGLLPGRSCKCNRTFP
jgi:hypothetical protein